MDNIILIGMPGCGKSTVGVVLAKQLGYGFIDCDIVLQEHEGKRLHEVLESVGAWGFNKIEDDINASIHVNKTVIATGGSAIYGEKAMKHFAASGTIVFMKMSLHQILDRVGDLKKRGVSMTNGKSLEELYRERLPLYEKYADVIVNIDGMSISESAEAIQDVLKQYKTE